ncbi:MAG: hypothetical protein H6Q72_2955 [Firmicutes bacterium]|nr:hypothetical protein [Bacillota bacterium]
MAFVLDKVVPWGRRLSEYQEMFCLSDRDLLDNKIISFGDGPASLNAEGSKIGGHIVSVDPLYQFSVTEIKNRIYETKAIVLEQTYKNRQNYIWDKIKSISELEKLRMSAMNLFLDDFEKGLAEKRYICGKLPDKTNFPDDSFDLGLSSHFLLLYSTLGWEFHLQSIKEMLRICKEIRIFPTCDLDSQRTNLLSKVIHSFGNTYKIKIIKTSYQFQKNGYEMLIIAKHKKTATAEKVTRDS